MCIRDSDKDVTSANGKTVNLNFFDARGYRYTAKFTFKQSGEPNTNVYSMELTKLLDSTGAEIDISALDFGNRTPVSYTHLDVYKRQGCVVENTGDPLKVTVNDKLLGKTVNGLGVPIDGEMINGAAYPVEAAPPDPMSRTIIDQVLPLGVKAVDGMITRCV